MNLITKRSDRIKALAYPYELQPVEWVQSCNLCGGDYFVQITHEDRYGYPASASLCGSCGLVFLNPRMTADAYHQFYSNVYRPLVSAYHGREINSQTIQSEQRSYAQERANFVAPFIEPEPTASLLDVGGSTGIVAHHFSNQFGFLAKVVDPSADELEEAKKRGLETIEGFIEEINIEGEKFDLILLCQTIDHLLDIRKTLLTIRDCLKEAGFFFVDIVDFRAAYLRNRRVEEAIKIDHPYYLTQDSVEAYLKQAGFQIVTKGFAADYLHITYLCVLGEPEEDFLPEQNSVERLLWELRGIQNGALGSQHP